MPVSYGMHPILNIEHLEKYQESPSEFGEQPKLTLNRLSFDELPKYEVDWICVIYQLQAWGGYLGDKAEFEECSRSLAWLGKNQSTLK